MPSSDGSDSSSSSATESTITAAELKTIYTSAFAQDARISDILRVLDAIIDRDTTEDVTIETLNADIAALARLISINTKDILYLNILLGKLIFELYSQGIEINNKELLQEMKLFYKI